MAEMLALKPTPAVSRYEAAMAALGIRLPLSHDPTEPGTIIDADGNMVCVADMNRERPDVEAAAIAELVLLAVNVHAGFVPEVRHVG
ncbi:MULTISPECIES: hypothetical protein [Rhizobium]|uniref:hypothetical protein n=1 Tax=Rhizobium phaseoli TaxID=396 RepID=UPI000F737DE9|nr:hypothetical protein [Rhizobium phaseoli]